VCDVTQAESFDALEGWFNELTEKASPSAQIAIVGNKIDLPNDRVVQTDVAEQWAKDHKAKCYLEVSAKTGAGIKELFAKAVELVAPDKFAVPEKLVTVRHSKGNADNADNAKCCCCGV
jgi:GTPase SAR1 family protein